METSPTANCSADGGRPGPTSSTRAFGRKYCFAYFSNKSSVLSCTASSIFQASRIGLGHSFAWSSPTRLFFYRPVNHQPALVHRLFQERSPIKNAFEPGVHIHKNNFSRIPFERLFDIAQDPGHDLVFERIEKIQYQFAGGNRKLSGVHTE